MWGLVACLLCRNPNFPDVKLAQAAVLCDSIAAFIKQEQQRQRQQSQPQRQQQQQRSQPPPPQPQQSRLQQDGRQDMFDMPVVIGGDFNSLWQKYSSDPWDKVCCKWDADQRLGRC
jgi:hypothetical protein